MLEIRDLHESHSWDYENGYYWFAPYSRMAKQIAHWEIYKKILSVPGDIIELGVYKGASLLRWATFREITENSSSRKITGFDCFGKFILSKTSSDLDKEFVKRFEAEGGGGIEH